jgi:CubicO group peptidase (beta-lactamase class C family)
MKNHDKVNCVFNQLCEKYSKNKRYKHFVVHAESMDQSYQYKHVSGIISSNQKPMTEKIPFNIASVTKLYIATIIMMLEEEGLLSINDKLSKYLPQETLLNIHKTHEEDLTIYHLLSHSSGIPDYLEIKNDDGKTLFDQIVNHGDHYWERKEFFQVIKDHKNSLFPPQPINNQKKKIRYSDTNYQLLMEIIEKITQQTIEEVFEKRIYQPIKLKHTYHEGTKKSLSYLDKASIWANDKEMIIPKALSSFKDIYSTSDEMITFMRALLQGSLFKSMNTINKMISNWNTFGFQLIPTSPGWPIQYGLGFMRFKYPKFLLPFKDIPDFYGHTGVTGSWLFYCPAFDLIVAGDVGQLTASATPFRFMSELILKLKKVSSS